MTLYVLDAYAVLELEDAVPPGVRRDLVFQALTQCVEDDELTFPDSVLTDCRAYAAGEFATVWLLGVAAGRNRELSRFPGNMAMSILDKVDDLVAPDDGGEQSQVAVACLAVARAKAGHDVCVVTDDVGLGGARMTLGEACEVLGIECCDIRECLRRLGV